MPQPDRRRSRSGRTRLRAFPPGPGAIGAEAARGTAAVIGAMEQPQRSDLAMEFAPAHATSVEPLLHGHRYFPRMIEDFEAADHHIHILIYGYKPGTIGTRILDVLAAKVRAGVTVRLEVDAMGSEINLGSKALYRQFRAAGIETVANHGLPINRLWRREVGGNRGRRADLLHFDHRKMAVIDGRVAYVGGSGIEDHFTDERFYDVMCRMTGSVVAQLQLVFLASWRYHGGEVPTADALEACFPMETIRPPGDSSPGLSATVLWNVPGTGHHPISDAFEQSIAAATTRIDIVNPYVSNRAILRQLYAAARRGVRVRVIVPGKPTPPYSAAAFRHHYPRLFDAGAEILLHPEMAHAKVATIDDRVLIGGCNLDDLSLFRNDELDVMLEGPGVAELVDRDVFDELAGMSSPATASTRARERVWNATMDRLSRLF